MGLFFGQNRVVGGNVSKNGYLYNWYAASTTNFAPTDWKVPTKTEAQTLETYLGGSSVAGGKMKESGLTHWSTPNNTGTSSGFKAFGSGRRGGIYYNFGTHSELWTLTEDSGTNGVSYLLWNESLELFGLTGGTGKTLGGSIRLLWDGSGSAPSTITDYDGNTYDTVVIGTQTWLVQNWACTHLNEGTALTKVTDQTTWSGLTTEGYCAYDNDENNVFV